MKASARYPKIVEWSSEDQCYVGRCPSLFHGGCHGDDEQAVFAELCDLVEESILIRSAVAGHLATVAEVWSAESRQPSC